MGECSVRYHFYSTSGWTRDENHGAFTVTLRCAGGMGIELGVNPQRLGVKNLVNEVFSRKPEDGVKRINSEMIDVGSSTVGRILNFARKLDENFHNAGVTGRALEDMSSRMLFNFLLRLLLKLARLLKGSRRIFKERLACKTSQAAVRRIWRQSRIFMFNMVSFVVLSLVSSVLFPPRHLVSIAAAAWWGTLYFNSFSAQIKAADLAPPLCANTLAAALILAAGAPVFEVNGLTYASLGGAAIPVVVCMGMFLTSPVMADMLIRGVLRRGFTSSNSH